VEALLYERLPEGKVRCHTCQRRCEIREGARGWCLTRENRGGSLWSLTYGRVSSVSINPIEKKPVYHFHPGSLWLSLGSWGCNFRCPGCQNWEIAHSRVEEGLGGEFLSPKDQVEMALRHGCKGLSWTFNEPTLWLEYTLDAAKLAKEKGLSTNYVTNGFITEEAFAVIEPFLDVYRVDIKGFSRETYERLAQIREFRGILRVAERAKAKGIHVEIVTNVIPGLNDDETQLSAIASWIKDNLGDDTPWHATRFHPQLRLSHLGPTPVATLERAREIGTSFGLRYVYVGNVPGHPWENTYCHNCGALLIKRHIFKVSENHLRGGRCPQCATTIPGTF
jgi:pyruvate formate lyase activating enzyme